jgi:hypothetical protein
LDDVFLDWIVCDTYLFYRYSHGKPL